MDTEIDEIDESNSTIDDACIELGFTNEMEMHIMIARVDISTQARFNDFRRWQLLDGTKSGLIKLSTRKL